MAVSCLLLCTDYLGDLVLRSSPRPIFGRSRPFVGDRGTRTLSVCVSGCLSVCLSVLPASRYSNNILAEAGSNFTTCNCTRIIRFHANDKLGFAWKPGQNIQNLAIFNEASENVREARKGQETPVLNPTKARRRPSATPAIRCWRRSGDVCRSPPCATAKPPSWLQSARTRIAPARAAAAGRAR